MANQILRQRLIAWAEQRVREHPTYETSAYDSAQKKHIAVEMPNTVERELAAVLADHLGEELIDYAADELRDYVLQLATEGTKGYRQMGRDELFKEIEDELADPDLFPEGATPEEIAEQCMDDITS